MKVQGARVFSACFTSLLPKQQKLPVLSFEPGNLTTGRRSLQSWYLPRGVGIRSPLRCPELILLFHGIHLRCILAGLVALLLK